jgi:hypothetical protein|tara:strand:- start:13 stop:714 length:702 start_codon:yes stop_codon:yes gene_type:complete
MGDSIRIELTRESRRETERLLEKYSKITGKGVEDGIKEVGKSVAKRLAITVQPFGINSSKGKKFMESIGHQVDRVFVGVNMGYLPRNSIASAHAAARRDGSVPRRKSAYRSKAGHRWKNIISMGDKEQYKRKVQAHAGIAKSGWITAGEMLGAGKITGVAKWIRRHVGKGGKSRVSGRGMKAVIELENTTGYIRSIQNDRAVQSAIKTGYSNGYKRLVHIIKQAEKKAANLSK